MGQQSVRGTLDHVKVRNQKQRKRERAKKKEVGGEKFIPTTPPQPLSIEQQRKQSWRGTTGENDNNHGCNKIYLKKA
jgi:hypothetical protein